MYDYSLPDLLDLRENVHQLEAYEWACNKDVEAEQKRLSNQRGAT